MTVHAEELRKVTLTSYNLTGTMANGSEVHPGVIAGREEDMGKVAILWKREPDGSIGDYIGIYEFTDKGAGKNGAITKGYVVDVWCPKGEELPTTKCYMQIIDAEG